MSRAKPTKRTEFGNIWDENDPDGMLDRWGNHWMAWMWWVIVLEEAEVWLGERAVHHKDRDGEEVMPALLAVRAMLLGYAVECALKALWVRKKSNDLIRNGKYVGVKGARDHNLVQLAQQAGFIPTTVEAQVLRRLTKFALFAGRYPVARTAEDMRPDVNENRCWLLLKAGFSVLRKHPEQDHVPVIREEAEGLPSASDAAAAGVARRSSPPLPGSGVTPESPARTTNANGAGTAVWLVSLLSEASC